MTDSLALGLIAAGLFIAFAALVCVLALRGK